MDVTLSEEQELLQQSAREFLSAECPMERVREAMDDPHGVDPGRWKKMAELGWLGLSLPEAYGGVGLDLLSLALVCQEMGRVLLPEPYLSTVALGARALMLGGSEAQKSRILPAVAEGQAKLALGQLESDLSWSADAIRLEARAEPGGEGFRLDGEKLFVTDAQAADWLILPARTSGSGEAGITLFILDTRTEAITIEPVQYTDQTRKVCRVKLQEFEAGRDNVLGDVDQGWALLQKTLDHAKVALSAEMLGGAEAVLEMSVEFAKNREQFGRPIGSFQAIQHKCVGQMINVESIRSALYYAAWAVENDEPDAHLSACLAKSFCGEAFSQVAAEGIQIHGGLGFTWEQDLHLYYKRAKAAEMWLGDGDWNRELAARELLD